MTRKEFLKSEIVEEQVRNLNISSGVCIVGGIVSIVVALAAADLDFSPIDGVALVILGVILYYTKSMIPAVLILLLGGVNMIVMMIEFDRPGGWLYVVAGLSAVKFTNDINKKWKEYRKANGFADTSVTVEFPEDTRYAQAASPTVPIPAAAPKSAPAHKTAPVPVPPPGLAPQPAPAPYVEPAPAPQPEPQPASAPYVEPAPAPQPVSAPNVEPAPAPQPEPAPAPQPVAAPQPEPAPAPVSQPVPAPEPEPAAPMAEAGSVPEDEHIYGYRIDLPDRYGYHYYCGGRLICRIEGSYANNSPVDITGGDEHWYCLNDRNVRAAAGQRRYIINKADEMTNGIVEYREGGSYLLNYKTENLTAAADGDRMVFTADDKEAASIVTERGTFSIKGEDGYIYATDQRLSCVTDESIGAIRYLVMAFPLLRFD